jgi:hypothetical protein
MSRSTRGFRYPLEPMRSKRQWERDALGHEVAKIDTVLATQRERLSETEQLFARARKEWQNRAAENRSLNVGMQRIFAAYLADAGNALDSQKKEVAATQASRGEAAERLVKAQRILDGVERHKVKLVKEHERGELAKQYREFDAAWIQLAGQNRDRRK